MCHGLLLLHPPFHQPDGDDEVETMALHLLRSSVRSSCFHVQVAYFQVLLDVVDPPFAFSRSVTIKQICFQFCCLNCP